MASEEEEEEEEMEVVEEEFFDLNLESTPSYYTFLLWQQSSLSRPREGVGRRRERAKKENHFFLFSPPLYLR